MNKAASYLDNSPNAEKLLNSLRYLGYDNLLAICDMVDNSLDADAQIVRINVQQVRGEGLVLQIADNGIGMTEDILDQASRLGSKTPRNAGMDLGRFGMGLVTASLSMGKRLTIITRTQGGEPFTNITDIDHMINANQFIKEYFGPARKEEVQIFEKLLGDSPSGTVIQISNTDGFTRKYTKTFQKELMRHIGQVYRMYIRTGRTFYVNGEKVEVNDPLWLESKDTGEKTKIAEVYSDETYNVKYVNAHGQEVEEPIRIRLAILPDQGSTHLSKLAGYKSERSGFYILRNNREIAAAQLLGITPLARHPDFIRFRGEIFITGHLDDAFGIEFTKRDIRLTQSVRDQIEVFIGGELKSIRSRLKKQVTISENQKVDHSHAEKLIESKASLLLKPPIKGQSYQPKRNDFIKSKAEPTNDFHKEDADDTPLGTAQFRTSSFGKTGPIYVAEQKGRTTIIEWNVDHPFYERFVLANRDNNDTFNAVDAMVFSMAVAELRTFDESSQHFIDTWMTIFSANLRTLLS